MERFWRRVEPVLFGLFLACWLVAVLAWLGWLPRFGTVGPVVDLYPLYGLAAVLGWLGGNIHLQVVRSHELTGRRRRRSRTLWFLGPQGIPALVRALAPAEVHAAAPAVPLFALAVGAVFFAVPLVFGRVGRPRG